jgi:hypothetical protein
MSGSSRPAQSHCVHARFPRAEASAAESAANLQLMFGDNPLERLLDQFASAALDK